MSRQLDNLKRLFGEMRGRYGEDDPIVSQFKQEMQAREGSESDFQQLTAAGPHGTPGDAAVHRREVVSRHPSERLDLH